MSNSMRMLTAVALIVGLTVALAAIAPSGHAVEGLTTAMLINAANLDNLRVGFKANFQSGLGTASAMSEKVATIIPSATREEKYGWLGKIPRVREWIGDRIVQNLMQSDYAIKNKSWELTIGVDRDDISDDNIGIYAPLFQTMGQETGSNTDALVFDLLANGFGTNCYDGQFFFDTDHPVLDANGIPTQVSNTGGGAGSPWFLLCTNAPLKPIIYQKRKDWEFVNRDNPNDANVFTKKEFQYGADARGNVGFGFWQMAYGSKQTLDPAAYKTARQTLTGMKGDFGKPLGLMPNLLVVGATGESAGRKILNSEYAAGGETNEWKGTAELLVCPWLP